MYKSLIIIIILSAIVIIEGVLLVRFWPKKPRAKAKIAAIPSVAVPTVAKIAIVIDDWGYNLRNENFLSEFNYPVTISILPHLAYSSQIAYLTRKNNKEIILHLPMEPHERKEIHLEKQVVFTHMNEKEIIQTLNDALKSVPFSSGVNNHMGSRATEDERVMAILFRQLKKKKLYFLDSFVTSYSICESLAEKMNVRFVQRDVFLDNQADYKYIVGQLQLLVKKAKKKGFAVGVGHDRQLTLQAIKDFAPAFEKQGIKLVFVSEAVK
ncbi:MAG: divergent polysaccharide deacetylase family protein [Candidatus Omnitrophota bacterium]|nr:divergent polysaccharide deacetylase family protein [Candidatus Omnitrophota bacterium]